MSEIYAVSLSASQGPDGASVRANLIYSDDGRTTSASIEWPEMDGINAAGNSSEWLYSLLSRLLMEYDVHTVVSAKTTPAPGVKVVNQREA